MKHPKMIGAHRSPDFKPGGIKPNRARPIDGGIHNRDFLREVIRRADCILNPQRLGSSAKTI